MFELSFWEILSKPVQRFRRESITDKLLHLYVSIGGINKEMAIDRARDRIPTGKYAWVFMYVSNVDQHVYHKHIISVVWRQYNAFNIESDTYLLMLAHSYVNLCLTYVVRYILTTWIADCVYDKLNYVYKHLVSK